MDTPVSNKRSLEALLARLLAEAKSAEESQIPQLAQRAAQELATFIGTPSDGATGIEEVLGDESHFVLYPQRYEFYVNFGDGVQKVHLTPIEFKVMEYLMRGSGKALSRQDILNAGWEPQNTLQNDLSYVKGFIMSLRKKLGVQAEYIGTIHGVGYRYNIFSTPINDEERVLHYKDLSLDPARWDFYKGDKLVYLSPTEFRIMKMLMENKGIDLTAKQLLAFRESEVPKDYESSEERRASAHIRNLRVKIGDNASHPTYIVGVRGFGYKMPVEALK